MMKIKESFTLPCGVEVANRIVKSAMSEDIADKGNFPGKRLFALYKKWTDGKPGILITGNVMIDSAALGEPHNVVVEDEKNISSLQEWAAVSKGTETQIWVQINHPGRQAMRGLNKECVAPSAIGVKTPIPGIFPKPRVLEESEIWDIINRFGNTAEIIQKAGFHGVQIHGAHGYLVSQFLSPLTNQRTDQWGGSLENRARFVVEVYKAIRKKVGADFPVGIKINSADFQRGGFSEEESMEVVKMLSELDIDMIEVSGGTYEKAAMMGSNAKKSTQDREAYFLDYIEKVRGTTDKPLLLTGGFRNVNTMEIALSEDKVDFIGIARPFCIYPELPRHIFSGEMSSVGYPSPKTGFGFLDQLGFIELLWCQIQIKNIANGKNPDLKVSPWKAMMKMVGF